MGKEVFTIQLGNAANYVGTHYWNIQSLYAELYYKNPEGFGISRLFQQERDSSNKPVLTPRTLIFDLKENFGTVQSTGEVFGESDNASKSDNLNHNGYGLGDNSDDLESNFDIYKQSQYSSKFKQGNEVEPRFWSDFSSATFGYQSLQKISSVNFGGDLGEMKSFDEGYQVFKQIEKEDGVLDSEFRQILEKCDELEMFQVFSESSGGFSGFSKGFLEYLRDELNKKTIMLYSVSNSPVTLWNQDQMSDTGITVAQSMELEVPMIPLYVPQKQDWFKGSVFSQLNLESNHQLAAVQSMVVDSISFPIISGDCSYDELLYKSNYTTSGIPISSNLYLGDSDTEINLNQSVDFIGEGADTKNKDTNHNLRGWVFARGSNSFGQALETNNVDVFIDSRFKIPPMFPLFRRTSISSIRSYGSIIKDLSLVCRFECDKGSLDFTDTLRKTLSINRKYRQIFGQDEVESWDEVILSKTENSGI